MTIDYGEAVTWFYVIGLTCWVLGMAAGWFFGCAYQMRQSKDGGEA